MLRDIYLFMLVIEFCTFKVLPFIGWTGRLFKRKNAIPTAATATTVARTIAAMPPLDSPFSFENLLVNVAISGL